MVAIAAWIRRCIPRYEPHLWNDANGIQYSNNCYNYATNLRTNTFAQPGRASGNMYSSLDCSEVGDGAVSDGLISTDCDYGCGCRDCCHKVALVMAPGIDYHWYRQDRNGRWSHKPGGTAATNLDNSGNIITDPRTANRGIYTVFCGCYCVCRGRVSIS
ncbi:MAG: hypothetical protein ACE5Q6_20850 [Dehalococcoidia bacterium]